MLTNINEYKSNGILVNTSSLSDVKHVYERMAEQAGRSIYIYTFYAKKKGFNPVEDLATKMTATKYNLRKILIAIRNEGLKISRLQDQETNEFKQRSYKKSLFLLKKAQKIIPLGSQTFSKSYINWPMRTSFRHYVCWCCH